MLVQKMAVNADLGFLLALVAFLSSGQSTPQLEVYVCVVYDQSNVQQMYMCIYVCVYIEQNCKASYISHITHTITEFHYFYI